MKRPLVVDTVCSEVGEHTESSNEQITESEALSPPSQLRILLPLARAGWDQRDKMINKCNASESEIHNYTREEFGFMRNIKDKTSSCPEDYLILRNQVLLIWQ